MTIEQIAEQVLALNKKIDEVLTPSVRSGDEALRLALEFQRHSSMLMKENVKLGSLVQRYRTALEAIENGNDATAHSIASEALERERKL